MGRFQNSLNWWTNGKKILLGLTVMTTSTKPWIYQQQQQDPNPVNYTVETGKWDEVTHSSIMLWRWAPSFHTFTYHTKNLNFGEVFQNKTKQQQVSQKPVGKIWRPLQTCSRPPLKSTAIFGMACCGPGLPLCLHHLASRLTVAENGPIRIRLLSLRLVLRRKSLMLRRNDDPRLLPEGEKKKDCIV